jgi:uncharacterized protein (TIGR02246 family)
MSKILKLATALLVVAGVSACNDEPLTVGPGASAMAPQAAVSGSPGDLNAMQNIADTFNEAWNAGDGAAYAAQYHGAEWIGPNGNILTDPAAITALYTGLLTFVFPGTTGTRTIRNLTFLTGTIAVLDIDARVTGFGPLPPGINPWKPDTIRALEKNILVKRGGEWRIVKHQQTAVAPGVQ